MLVESIAFDSVPAATPTPDPNAEGGEEPEAPPVPGTLTVARAHGETEAQTHFAEDDILVFDQGTLDTVVVMLTNTITCGRVGTAMPAWAQSQNGPLSDEQIRQLTVLITTGHWDVVAEEVDREDAIATHLTAPIGIEDTQLQVEDVSLFEVDAYIRVNGERMRIVNRPEVATDASDKSGAVEVERAVLGTTPLEHEVDSELFRFPAPPEDPAVNQSACGQTARPPTDSSPPGLIEPFEGQTVEVVAAGVQFDTDEITIETGGQVRVRLDNQDAGTPHNIAFYVSDSDLTPVSEGSVGTIFNGVAVDDTVFDVPDAGDYYFQCDVHPNMNGALIVE
jgi:plastocyanin